MIKDNNQSITNRDQSIDLESVVLVLRYSIDGKYIAIQLKNKPGENNRWSPDRSIMRIKSFWLHLLSCRLCYCADSSDSGRRLRSPANRRSVWPEKRRRPHPPSIRPTSSPDRRWIRCACSYRIRTNGWRPDCRPGWSSRRWQRSKRRIGKQLHGYLNPILKNCWCLLPWIICDSVNIQRYSLRHICSDI